MSNCKILSEIEHFASAKNGGFIIPSEYSNILTNIVPLIDKAIQKGIIKNANSLENINALYPDSANGYNAINHQGLEKPKQMINNLMQKYGLITNSNTNDIVKQR